MLLALLKRTELEEQFLMARYQKELLRLGWAVPKRHSVLERKISCMDHLSNTLCYFYSVFKALDTKRKIILKAFASMLLFAACSRCHGLGDLRLKNRQKKHIRLSLLSCKDNFCCLVADLFHLPTALLHYIS